MKKVFFFDIDDTLQVVIDHKRYIPSSAKKTIQQLKRNGNLCFVCTGRSKIEIDNDIKSVGFDGYIEANGTYIEVNDKSIYHKKIMFEEFEKIEEYFKKNNIHFYIESNDGLYINQSSYDFYVKHHYNNVVPKTSQFLIYLTIVDDFTNVDINKIVFFSNDISFEKIFETFKDNYHVVQSTWMKNIKTSGEINLNGITKASAIHFLLDYLNLEQKDTVAFGDSLNDLEMLQFVDTAVVMGNGNEKIKEYADFITNSVLNDGIEYACKHFKWID